jgi:hypothetical protein
MFDGITATNLQELNFRTNPNLSEEQTVRHKILLKPGTEPVKQKNRGIPYSFRKEFEGSVSEMLNADMIRKSESPCSSPVRLVRKNDGRIRVCVDYRKLNSITIKDAFPLPRIEDLFTYLTFATIFTVLDLTSGYYQVAMSPESQKYTAFSCEFGFYEYKVMPMGLTNACATFQRLMNSVLNDLLGTVCLVYLDDIIIFSQNIEEHKRHVRMVVDRLRANNLKIKLSKCKIARRCIQYLSHIIEGGTIRANPEKIAAVRDFPVPTTVKTVQSFLGLVSYYRKFIKDCGNICSPLIKLTMKGVAFVWSPECQTAFERLKDLLTISGNILILPDMSKPFRIECDASKYGIGGVLSQQVGDKHWLPVAYFSKHLNKIESGYSASEREMLAIVLCIV